MAQVHQDCRHVVAAAEYLVVVVVVEPLSGSQLLDYCKSVAEDVDIVEDGMDMDSQQILEVVHWDESMEAACEPVVVVAAVVVGFHWLVRQCLTRLNPQSLVHKVQQQMCEAWDT